MPDLADSLDVLRPLLDDATTRTLSDLPAASEDDLRGALAVLRETVQPITASADPSSEDIAVARACSSFHHEIGREAQRRIDGLRDRRATVERLAAPLSRSPSIQSLAQNRRASRSPSPRVEVTESVRWRTPSGREFNTTADIAGEILERLRTFSDGRLPIATARWELDPERRLGADPAENRERLAAVVSPQALVASGGICAPASPKYDFPTSVSGSRPVRDALPRFDGQRGGIVFLPAPTLATVSDGAVGITTEAEDVSGENYPKPCLVVSCDPETELSVQATHRCLQFSNFNARTHPELVEEYVTLAIAAVARAAEDSLWDLMVASSTAVTTGETLSATRDVLASVSRAAAAIRSRHRMPQDFPVRWLAPAWLIDLMQTDLARQSPGDSSMGISRAAIESWLNVRGIRPAWSLDSGGQVFGTQGAGGLLPWASTVETLLFAEGTFVHVDGGELDLGITRDASLNETNDLQIFGEVFETVGMVGVESLALTLDLCPSGLASGHADDADDLLCTVGS